MCRSLGASAGAELAADLVAVEKAVHDALASALQVKWPVSRWPIYVFTGERFFRLAGSQRRASRVVETALHPLVLPYRGVLVCGCKLQPLLGVLRPGMFFMPAGLN